MGVAIEGFIVFLLFCMAAGKGMPWTILFLPAYLGVLSLKVTPVGRRIKLSRVFLLSLAAFVAITLVTSVVLFGFLVSVDESISNYAWLDFFLGSDLLKILWSVLLSAMLAIDILLLVLLPYAALVARGKYSGYAEYTSDKKRATHAALKSILGISQGTWNVREGKVDVTDKSDSILARFGGPAILIVQLGNAVILEQSGKISRIVASGLAFLEPFERISTVVPLQTRLEQIVVEQVATRDKVLITEFEFLVFHRVDRGPEISRIDDGQFSYSQDVLFTRIWSPSGGDWRESVKSISGRAARDVIGRYNLADILPLTEARRQEFNRQLAAQINSITVGALGVEIIAVDTGKILVPSHIEEMMVSQWMADWEKRVSATRAETEQLVQLSKTTARMQSIQGISRGLRQLLGSKATAEDIIALRYIEYLEHSAESSGSVNEDQFNTLVKLQGLEALRSLQLPHGGAHGNNGAQAGT